MIAMTVVNGTQPWRPASTARAPPPSVKGNKRGSRLARATSDCAEAPKAYLGVMGHERPG